MNDFIHGPDADLPRPEYPRPQFVRKKWLNLNGPWEFAFDFGDSGRERGLCSRDAAYDKVITVPFCPESDLSGVGVVDFMNAVWYRRTVVIPAEWSGQNILLHFGAVDYDATVWVIGPSNAKPIEVGRHRGGFTPFTCDLRNVVNGGDTITLLVRSRDPARGEPMARGKQSTQYAPHACFYTRTTGIWQTVWMEPVPRASALKRPRITPDVAQSAFHLVLPLTQNRPGYSVFAQISDVDGLLASATSRADLDMAPHLTLVLPASRARLWCPADPHLYGLRIELRDPAGTIVDAYDSYAGLRSIALDGKKVKINGNVIFQRLVLDQGYYPDGVLTAPTDAHLENDIRLSLEAGFNGARLHQKVFEERFLYHADRLGYLVWGEFADWGISGYGPPTDHQQPGITYVAQWLEAVERDYSHPSIIGWCALNETHQTHHDRITNLDDATRALFLAAKALDLSRPVLDTSGYAHREPDSDIYDFHYYIEEKDWTAGLEKFTRLHRAHPDETPYSNPNAPHPTPANANPARTVWSIPYRGQPYFCSEFGGFKWNPNTEAKTATENAKDRKTSWGYGADPETLDDFYARFEATCHVLLNNGQMFGYCYTQLTDVYPEENGLFTFDRKAKFDNTRLRAIQSRVAAMETAEGF